MRPNTGKTKYTDEDFSQIPDPDVPGLIQCLNCGAHTLSGWRQDIKHYKGCQPGEAKYWEKFYEKEDQDVT